MQKDHTPSHSKRPGVISIVTLAVMLIIPIAASASHRFIDVADSNVFHDDISWLADSGVTLGCNPPANTQYCPDDYVTREQMAAFLHRLADNKVVNAASAETAIDADTVDGYHASELGGASYIHGLNRDSVVGSTLIPLPAGNSRRLVQKKIDETNGAYAFVTYNVFFQEESGIDGYVIAWLQIDDPSCNPVQAHPGTFTGQSSGPDDWGTMGSSVVLPVEATTGITLCAEAIDSNFAVYDVALNTVQTDQGGSTLAPQSASDASNSQAFDGSEG